MIERIVYRLFGIPVWSVTREHQGIAPEVKESLYQEFSDRFGKEIREALQRVRTP